MKNKVLIRVYVVCLSEEYDIYIPVNESIKTIINLIVKSVSELSDNRLEPSENYCLLDCENNQLYSYATIVRNTNIVNGKKMFLI